MSIQNDTKKRLGLSGRIKKVYEPFFVEAETMLNAYKRIEDPIPEEITDIYNLLKEKKSRKAQELTYKYELFQFYVEEHNQTFDRVEEVVSSFDPLDLLNDPYKYKENRRQEIINALNDVLTFKVEEGDKRILTFIYYAGIIKDKFDDLLVQRDILTWFEKLLKEIDTYPGYYDDAMAEKAKVRETMLQTMIDCLEEQYYGFERVIPVEEAIKTHNDIFLSDHPDYDPNKKD